MIGASPAAAGTARVSNGQLVYEGGGDREWISVHYTRATAHRDAYYDVENFNAPARKVSAGPGCKPYDNAASVVYCEAKSVSRILLMMKGGDDNGQLTFTHETSTSSATYAPDPITINGGDGNDALFGVTSGPRVTLLGGPGRDRLDGTPADESPGNPLTARGGGGKDFILGSCGGADRLFGGKSDDSIFAKDGNKDVVDGGGGEDGASADKADEKESIERTANKTDAEKYHAKRCESYSSTGSVR